MSTLGTLLSLFGACFVSGIFPVASVELILIAAAALSPSSLAPLLVLAATLGQVAGKSVLYAAARGAVRLPIARLQRMVEAARARAERSGVERRGMGTLILLSSAAVSVPPHHLTAIACGMLRVSYVRFLLTGAVGRYLRFAALVFASEQVEAWLR